MKNVKSCYQFWLEKADKVLQCYRSAPSYQLFAETSFAVITQGRERSAAGKREGKEIFPVPQVFLQITHLLTLSRTIIHNRLRREPKPIPLLRKDSIPVEKVTFSFQEKEDPAPTCRHVVKESLLFKRINDVLEALSTEEGLRDFTEARQILMAYAMSVPYKSITVFSHVSSLLFFFQRAIEDAVAISRGEVANERF